MVDGIFFKSCFGLSKRPLLAVLLTRLFAKAIIDFRL